VRAKPAVLLLAQEAFTVTDEDERTPSPVFSRSDISFPKGDSLRALLCSLSKKKSAHVTRRLIIYFPRRVHLRSPFTR